MVAEWSGALLQWEAELAALRTRIGEVFRRSEGREMAGAFLDGLLSGAERKTGWLMAEQASLERPYRMQSLLGRGLWSADALRDIVRAYVFEALADDEGVLGVFVRRASIRRAWRAHILARRDGSKTLRLACS